LSEGASRVRYYSQYGQDRFVREQLLPGPTGYFIDIGADDGIDKSNTMAFEDAGWTGLCIEPSPERFKALRANRRCECLNVAISSTEGEERFLDILGYGKGLSGIVRHYDPRHVARIANETADNPLTRGRFEVTVPTRRLDALLEERGVTHVDFCSIDVEGSELEVLESIDFGAVSFDVVAIEDVYGNERIRARMQAHDFMLHATVGQDLIYVAYRFARNRPSG
jgi:FkbM family methyltransferase